MSTPPPVAKTIFTEADYGTMNWHDNAVHAIAWEPLSDDPGRLLLGIDYILPWAAAEPPARALSFWISPATLVFAPLGPDHRHRPDRVEFPAVPRRDQTLRAG